MDTHIVTYNYILHLRNKRHIPSHSIDIKEHILRRDNDDVLRTANTTLTRYAFYFLPGRISGLYIKST
jgi:hypothetical protein